MAMKRLKDVAVKTGTYTKNGETKNRYENVGTLVEFDNGGQGLFLKRTFNPAGVANPDGRDDVLLSLFDLRDDAGKPPQAGGGARPKPSAAVADDEVPFN